MVTRCHTIESVGNKTSFYITRGRLNFAMRYMFYLSIDLFFYLYTDLFICCRYELQAVKSGGNGEITAVELNTKEKEQPREEQNKKREKPREESSTNVE